MMGTRRERACADRGIGRNPPPAFLALEGHGHAEGIF